MKTQIQSVHFDADKKLVSFIEEKTAKLKTFQEGLISCDVTLKIDKGDNNLNKIAEIKMHAPGQELFAKKNCKTFEEAIDTACDALKTQIIKHKQKIMSVK